jgi:hypothetical protein
MMREAARGFTQSCGDAGEMMGARRRAEGTWSFRRISRIKRNSAPPRFRVIPLFAAALLFATTARGDDAKPKCACATNVPVIVKGMQTAETLSLDDLRKLPPVKVSVTQHTDHGDVVDAFSGPLLWTILDSAGWVNGPQKNAYLSHTIFVTGADGYAAALSEGEIDPKLEGKQVILATDEDGKPLDAPRLVVPGDAHASRGVHDVVSIEVK